jgi:hypothetical protein
MDNTIVREVVLARQDAQGAPCKFSSLVPGPRRSSHAGA